MRSSSSTSASQMAGVLVACFCFFFRLGGFLAAIAAVAIISRSIGMRSIGSKPLTLLDIECSLLNDVEGAVVVAAFRCEKFMSSPLDELCDP